MNAGAVNGGTIESGGEWGDGEEVIKMSSDCRVIVGRSKECRIANYLGDRATGRCNNGEAGGHGLDQYHPILFLPGRSGRTSEEENICMTE